jgi:hypothetical protein
MRLCGIARLHLSRFFLQRHISLHKQSHRRLKSQYPPRISIRGLKATTLQAIMDPLSALGVAASIVQFIQFGSSITSQALEIYKSSEGSSADNFECENASKRLRELCNRLKNTGCYGIALKKICEGCLEVAEELETLLCVVLSTSHVITPQLHCI